VSDFPPIGDELRPRAKLKRHDIQSDDNAIEANARLLGEKWGASTRIEPSKLIEPLAPVVSIRGYIPQYLDDDLARVAAERRVTKTFLLMEALRTAGYRVDDQDMIQDRRKAKRP
jgi:hypothetical protein